jgi:hypothetical protein
MNEKYEIEEAGLWLVIFITLMGGVLRILLLDNKGMWLDETFSVWMANQSIAEMLQWIVKIDQHPPLYYLLLHYWIAYFEDTPYYARLLSVVFSTGTIPVIYLIGKRISGVKTGLVAALILTLSPFNIRFAQETRMYALLTFNAAVAIYALVRLLTDAQSIRPIGSQFRDFLRAWRAPAPPDPEKDGDFSYRDEERFNSAQYQTEWQAWISRHRWPPIRTIETDLTWVAFIVFSAATMLSHNTAVLFPIAANIFVLGLMLVQRIKEPESSLSAFQAPSLGNWIKAQIGILLIWSPWIPAFIQQASRVYQEFWIPEPSWDAIIQTLKTFLNASTPTPNQTGELQIIWVLYALVLCLGLLHFRKKFSQFVFLATLFAIPFLGELIVSIRRPIFYDRTLIWTTIPLFLILAAGIIQLRYRYLIIATIILFGTINLFFASDYFRFMQKENWFTPAGYVANFAEKDDLVLFNSNLAEIPFDYYFREYEDLYSIQVVKQGVPLDLFDSGVPEPKMAESDIPRLISLINEHERVWLVYSHNWYTDPMGLIPQTLASKMELNRQRDFYGGQVQLYVIP